MTPGPVHTFWGLRFVIRQIDPAPLPTSSGGGENSIRGCVASAGTATVLGKPLLSRSQGQLAPRSLPGALHRPHSRRPYHSTRTTSSKKPGKTKSSLAMAQRRPKSTIPGMAKVLLPALRTDPARREAPSGRRHQIVGVQVQAQRGRRPAHAHAEAETGARALSPTPPLPPELSAPAQKR